MLKAKTELQEKIEMIDGYAKIKDVVNNLGGSITYQMPYIEYSKEVAKIGSKKSEKFGTSIDVMLGELSSSGSLSLPTEQGNIRFDGMKSVGSQALMYKFYNCNIVSVEFSDLEKLHTPSAMEEAFAYCTLESVSFPKCTEISGARALYGAFRRNSHLKSVSFDVLSNLGTATSQFDDMLDGVTGCTVHFPSALQATIENWTSVQNGFGGTNTVVLWDL